MTRPFILLITLLIPCVANTAATPTPATEQKNIKYSSVAAKPLKISEHNKALTKQNLSLEATNDMLKQEVQVLRDDSDKQWFLMGSGTILLGMLIGLLLPKLRRRRKSDWDKF